MSRAVARRIHWIRFARKSTPDVVGGDSGCAHTYIRLCKDIYEAPKSVAYIYEAMKSVQWEGVLTRENRSWSHKTRSVRP